MLIGEKIKSYRTQVGLSQEDLAYELDVSRQTISSWENNKTYPGIRSIIALSEIFHISVEEFIKEDVETMKDILDGYKAERIKRNKDRDILNRMVAVRAFLGFVGALTAYPVYQYLGWPMLLIPASMLMGVVAFTFPIEHYRKKYNLRKYQDIVVFLMKNIITDPNTGGQMCQRTQKNRPRPRKKSRFVILSVSEGS